MTDYLLLLAGLALLLFGGDLLVRGAVGLAEKLLVPPLIVGLTIVSFGTSAPELFISVEAALLGKAGIAVGNIVGSNIANVLLVLGVPALIKSCVCADDGIGKNLIVMLGMTVVFMGMMVKGRLEFYDGAILIALLVFYLFDQFQSAKKFRHNNHKNKTTPLHDVADYHDEIENVPTANWAISLMIVIGLVLLPLGAKFTIDSAVSIASSWHVSNEIIGLTVVAIGTSLPELAASVMAVYRGNTSVALGNVVGSNIFNIAAIMGITAMVIPLDVGEHIIRFDMFVMLAAAIGLALLAYKGKTIGKAGGAMMSGLYAAYIVLTLAY